MSDIFSSIRIRPRSARSPARKQAWSPKDIVSPTKPKKPRASRGASPNSRFKIQPLMGKSAVIPPFDAPYIVEGRTKYPTTLRDAGKDTVLKSGFHQSKIGAEVKKGKWKGMPIFCLTLEERKTCPVDCAVWRSCYGNGMQMAHRFNTGPALERAIRSEVAELSLRYPQGFVVRLHILGDFYSVGYVQLWAEMLDTYPMLRIFGYTARYRRDDPIAQALLVVAFEAWDRFAMRFSNAPVKTASTVMIEHAGQNPADAVICPAQLGQTESCATCALCWQTDKRIAFIRH